MNNAQRIGLGGSIVGGLAIAALVAQGTGALSDNLGARRLASATVTCPDDDDGACVIEVRRVRPLNASAVTDAQNAGLEVQPMVERVVRRSVARNALTTFLQNNTTAIP